MDHRLLIAFDIGLLLMVLGLLLWACPAVAGDAAPIASGVGSVAGIGGGVISLGAIGGFLVTWGKMQQHNKDQTRRIEAVEGCAGSNPARITALEVQRAADVEAREADRRRADERHQELREALAKLLSRLDAYSDRMHEHSVTHGRGRAAVRGVLRDHSSDGA